MEQVYHLYIKKECGHHCPLCCNKLYDIDKLPVITVDDLKQAHTVCLTGGEPFRVPPHKLIDFIRTMRAQYQNIKKVYIYSSNLKPNYISEKWWEDLFCFIDGVNIAPKNMEEWKYFHYLIHSKWFREITDNSIPTDPWGENVKPEDYLSNRIYIFDDQKESYDYFNWDLPKTWNVIGRKWDKVFNTPDNEHFVRLPILL